MNLIKFIKVEYWVKKRVARKTVGDIIIILKTDNTQWLPVSTKTIISRIHTEKEKQMWVLTSKCIRLKKIN